VFTFFLLHVKIDVGSTVLEISGGPKIPKVGHVTPHDTFWTNLAFCR